MWSSRGENIMGRYIFLLIPLWWSVIFFFTHFHNIQTFCDHSLWIISFVCPPPYVLAHTPDEPSVLRGRWQCVYKDANKWNYNALEAAKAPHNYNERVWVKLCAWAVARHWPAPIESCNWGAAIRLITMCMRCEWIYVCMRTFCLFCFIDLCIFFSFYSFVRCNACWYRLEQQNMSIWSEIWEGASDNSKKFIRWTSQSDVFSVMQMTCSH